MDDLEARAAGRVGQVLRGKWRLDRLLGVGGMASVYEATHRNGKRGAVKMLHTELALDSEIRTRFLREGYAANRVQHPGAVSVLDDDVAEDGTVFLVMELLDGETLDARAERHGGRLPLAEVLRIAADLLDVLASAHDRGIVHRDLKPENLFLTPDGRVKVLDFGIARIADGSARTTVTSTAMGTPAFMPPEQALGEWHRVDGRTDLWAVGATMFTLLSGRVVHEAETVQRLLLAAMTRRAPPLSSVAPGVPADVCAIVDRALEIDPQSRWQEARAMQSAVRAAAAFLSISMVPPAADAGATLRVPGSPLPEAPAGSGRTTVAVSSDAARASLAAQRSSRAFVVAAALGALLVGGALVYVRGVVLGAGPAADASRAASVAPSSVEPLETGPASRPSSASVATPTVDADERPAGPASVDGASPPPAASASPATSASAPRPTPAARPRPPRDGGGAPLAAPTAEPATTAAPQTTAAPKGFDGRF